LGKILFDVIKSPSLFFFPEQEGGDNFLQIQISYFFNTLEN